MNGKGQNGKEASPSQRDCFIEAARELDADEDETTFKAKLAVIGRQKLKGATEPHDEVMRPRGPR